MKKKLTIFAIVILVLIVGGVGILLLNINPILDKARPEIVKAISRNIGQPVEVGEISAQFFPSFAIKVADVRVKSADEKTPAQASVGSLLVNTSVSKLLAGEIGVKELALNDVQINARRNAAGELVIAGINLAERAKTAENKAASAQSDASPGSKKTGMVSLSVSVAELNNVRVNFKDEKVSPPQEINFVIESATLSDIGKNGTASLKVVCSALGTGSKNINLAAALNNPVLELPPARMLNSLEASLNELDLAKLTTLAHAYSPDAAALTMSATSSLSLSAKNAGEGADVTLKLNSDAADISFGDKFAKKAGVPLQLDAVAKLDNLIAPKVINASVVKLKVGSAELNLPAEIKLGEAISLTLKASETDLASLAALSPIAAAYEAKGSFSSDLQIKKSLTKESSAQAPALSGKLGLDSLSATLPGKGNVALSSLALDASSAPDNVTNLAIQLSSGSALGFDIGKTIIGAKLSPTQLRIPTAQLSLAGGSIKFATESSMVEPKVFSLNASGAGLNLEQLSKAAAPTSPISIAGTLESFTLSATGDSAAMPQSLKASFNGNVGKGEIKGLNIVGDSLTKITGVPGLEESFAGFIPEKYRWIVTNNSTAFDKLVLSAAVANSSTHLNTFRLEHQLYIIEVTGDVGFDGALKLEGKLRITSTLSQEMVLKQPKLKLLLDQNNNLVIPIVISKKGAIPVVVPDVSELAKGAAKNTAKEALGKELDKVAPGLGNGASKLLDKLF